MNSCNNLPVNNTPSTSLFSSKKTNELKKKVRNLNYINFISINANSMKDDLKRHTQLTTLFQEGHEIICIQDTRNNDKLNCRNNCKLCHNKYYDIIRTGNNHNRGVTTMIKKNIGFTVTTMFQHSQTDIKEGDSDWHWINLNRGNINIDLFNIYGPNVNNPEFFNLIKKKMNETTGEIIITGDLNITFDKELDNLNYVSQQNKKNQEIVETIITEFGLVDVVRKSFGKKKIYSFEKSEKKGRLDHLLCSNKLARMIGAINYENFVLSDHKSLQAKIKLLKPKRRWRLRSHVIKNKDFQEEMAELLQEKIDELESIDSNHQSIITELFKETKDLAKKYERKHWKLYERKYQKLKRKITNAKTIFDKLKADNDMTIFLHKRNLELYVDIRKKVAGEGLMPENLVKSSKSNDKMVILDKLTVNDEITSNKKKIKKHVERHFCGVLNGPRNLPKPKNILPSSSAFTSFDFEQYIRKKLKPRKSPGPSGISGAFFKTFPIKSAKIAFLIAEKARLTGKLPNCLTQGIISLIPKKGKERTEISNWRPITLLETMYKIISGTITEKILPTIKNLVPIEQKGFLPGRKISDISHNLATLLERAKKSQKKRAIVAFDFSKAFDTVKHKFILKGIEKHFDDNIYNMVRAFLHKNVSKVMINGELTRKIQCGKGARQGDPIAPYLFILALLPLMSSIKKGLGNSCIKLDEVELLMDYYADDNYLFLEGEDEEKLVNDIKKAFFYYDKFSVDSGLKVNKSKTNILLLGHWSSPPEEIDGTPVTDSITQLGIVWTRNGPIYEEFQKKLEKIKDAITNWSNKSVNLLTKVIFWNFYVNSGVLYYLRAVWQWQELIGPELEELARRIFKGYSLHTLQIPRKHGGFGLRLPMEIMKKSAAKILFDMEKNTSFWSTWARKQNLNRILLFGTRNLFSQKLNHPGFNLFRHMGLLLYGKTQYVPDTTTFFHRMEEMIEKRKGKKKKVWKQRGETELEVLCQDVCTSRSYALNSNDDTRFAKAKITNLCRKLNLKNMKPIENTSPDIPPALSHHLSLTSKNFAEPKHCKNWRKELQLNDSWIPIIMGASKELVDTRHLNTQALINLRIRRLNDKFKDPDLGDKCRFCKKETETIAHVFSNCTHFNETTKLIRRFFPFLTKKNEISAAILFGASPGPSVWKRSMKKTIRLICISYKHHINRLIANGNKFDIDSLKHEIIKDSLVYAKKCGNLLTRFTNAYSDNSILVEILETRTKKKK